MHQDNIFDHTRLKKKLYLAHKKYIVRLGYFEDRRKFTFCTDDGHWWIQTSKVILFYIIWFWSILLQRKFLFFNDFSLFLPPDSFSKLYNHSNQEFSLGKLKINHLHSYLPTLVPLEDRKSKKGQLHIRCICDAGNMSSHLFLRQKTCKFYCLFFKQINFLLRILRHPDDTNRFSMIHSFSAFIRSQHLPQK